MNNRLVLYFDDNVDIINNFKTAFEGTEINLEFMGFSDPVLFINTLNDGNTMKWARVRGRKN